MPKQKESKFQRLTKAIHQALRGKEPLSQEITRLALYIKLSQSADWHEEESNSAFIHYCLTEFQAKNPGQADLLLKRFVERESIKSIAIRLSQSQEQVNRQQKVAIETLSGWVLAQEERQQQEVELSLISGLVPPSYTQLFGAEKIASLLVDLLSTREAPWVISLVGLGGIGKTALADWALRRLIPNFPYQKLVWFRMDRNKGQPLLKEQLISMLCRKFMSGMIPRADQASDLRKYLKAHPSLIVLDNLDEELNDLELVELLQDLANPSKFLITSRLLPAPLAQAYTLSVAELDPAPALELLLYETRQRGLQIADGVLQTKKDEIYARTGGNPLALRLVAGLLHTWSLPTILASLQEKTTADIEKMYSGIFDKSWQAITDISKHVLLSMLLVGGEGVTEQHIQVINGLDKTNLRMALFELRQRTLLEMRGSILEPRYGIHHLTETFLRNKWSLEHEAFQQPLERNVRAALAFWISQMRTQQRNQIFKEEKGNLEKAVEVGFEIGEAQQVWQLLSDLFPAILELGAAREWAPRFKQALQWKRQAKEGSALFYQLGALQWQLGETEDALKTFSQSLELAAQRGLSRQQTAARLGVCLSYWSAQNYERAREEARNAEQELQAIEQSDPIHIRGLAIAGICAFAIKEYDSAISSFEKALEKLSGGEGFIRAQLELDLGLSLHAKGDFENAAKKYNTAAALLNAIPGSERTLANVEIVRASLHYQNKKIDAAKAALGRAARLLQIDKDDLEITAILEGQLGRVLFKAGEIEKAVSFLVSAGKLWEQLGNTWMFEDTRTALSHVAGK